MNARRLLHWGDLHRNRRNSDRGGLATLPAIVWSLLAGALLSAELGRRLYLGSELSSVSRLWLAVVIGLAAFSTFSVVYRLYWRDDSAFLARLAIPGESLFGLALLRSARGAAYVFLPCAMAAAVFAPDWAVVGRHLALLSAAFAASALLAPAAALAAGATVASSRAQKMLDSFGGEFSAPKTTWLGALPGFAATAIVLALMIPATWLVDGSGFGTIAVIALIGASCGCGLLSLRASSRVFLGAAREVAALDREHLAHVDRSTASMVERLWARLMLSDRGQLLADKDARLSRRRYPSPYFITAVGVVAVCIMAAIQTGDLLMWSGVVVACLGAYGVIMARRLWRAPTEYPRFLATLAISARDARVSKTAMVALRALLIAAVCGGAVAIRHPEPGIAALVIAGICVGFGTAAAALMRE